jgi:hypothetical protein
LKVTAQQARAFEELVINGIDKSAPVALEKGMYAGITLARSVYPSGEDASCNYIVSWNYAGLPPELTPESLESLFQAAGLGSYGAFMQKLSTMSRLMHQDLWATVARAGTIQKGDYFRLNRMKVKPENQQALAELERKRWKPVMDARVASGDLRGWSSYDHVLPAGTEDPYNAATVDIFPSWDGMWRQGSLRAVVEKIHPDMRYDDFIKMTDATRDLARAELYQVVTTHRKQ